MKIPKLIFLITLVVSTACAGLRPAAPLPTPNRVVVLEPHKRVSGNRWEPVKTLRVGDTIRLTAMLVEPESSLYHGKWYKTLPIFLWTSSEEILLLNPMNGMAVAKKAGKAQVCTHLFYTYLPLASDMKTVDYGSGGAQLTDRHGPRSEKERGCSTTIPITPTQ